MSGAGPLERAYTQIGAADEILHLNRFHDTEWAPVEVRYAATSPLQPVAVGLAWLRCACATSCYGTRAQVLHNCWSVTQLSTPDIYGMV